MKYKPKIGIFKFTGCAGCQMEIFRMEDEFLSLLKLFDITYWKMAKRDNNDDYWDIALIEGGISTPWEINEIKHIRKKSKFLVAFGDCAISGCIPSIRNWIPQMVSEDIVYEDSSEICSIKLNGIGEYVKVDSELKGCPPLKDNIIELLKSILLEIKPRLRAHPVCLECKLLDNKCLITSEKKACMGPVISAGCGAICPTLNRECEGCFGPMSNPNAAALADIFRSIGLSEKEVKLKFRKYAGMDSDFCLEAGD